MESKWTGRELDKQVFVYTVGFSLRGVAALTFRPQEPVSFQA